MKSNQISRILSKSQKFFISFILILIISLLFGVNNNILFAENNQESERPFKTGLNYNIKLTPKQKEKIEKQYNLSKNRKIKILPNKLAVERSRKTSTKSTMSINNAVPIGQEIIEIGNKTNTLYSNMQPLVVETLPSKIDNSLLPSFPIINSQGQLGSCTAYSTTYYQMTHMVGLLNNWSQLDSNGNKVFNPAKTFSPKFSYNMNNLGEDSGSLSDFIVESTFQTFGAVTWEEFPYIGSNIPATNYKELPQIASIWRNALKYTVGKETNSYGRIFIDGDITDVNSSNLNQVKGLLQNGYVMNIETNIYSWVFKKSVNDISTPNDDSDVGKDIAYKVTTEKNSGHAMTLVGYNDYIWVDINDNGIVDTGEKGAFKIANSWGLESNWTQQKRDKWNHQDNGFVWMSYDALNKISVVAGMQNDTSRGVAWVNFRDEMSRINPNNLEEFYSNSFMYFVPKINYIPKLLGEFKINPSQVMNLESLVDISDLSASTPPFSYNSSYYSGPGSFNFVAAGMNAFNGTLVPSDADIVLDYTNLIDTQNITNLSDKKYYVLLRDYSGANSKLKSMKLTDSNGNILSQSGLLDTNIVYGNQVWHSILLLSIPQNLNIVQQSNSLQLIWNPVNNANLYNIGVNNIGFLSTDTNFTYTYPSLIPNQLTTFNFKVRAKSSTTESGWSQIKQVQLKLIIIGDVNLDGSLSSLDLDLIKFYFANTTQFNADQKIAADVNADNIINNVDLVLVKRYFAGVITSFPAGYSKTIIYGNNQ